MRGQGLNPIGTVIEVHTTRQTDSIIRAKELSPGTHHSRQCLQELSHIEVGPLGGSDHIYIYMYKVFGSVGIMRAAILCGTCEGF